MKKALSVFLMLALVGSVFAAEPVADVNIAEFKGDASVQWGVNLDTGETGFKNSANVSLKLNLLNEGSKSTTGDGVWGELVIKTDGDTFAKATNTSSLGAGLGSVPMTVVVDKAQINFGPAYVGITSGDTQTGKLKMDAAVKSADSDNAVTLGDVGPKDYTQGITIGYKSDMFNVAADVRSFNSLSDVYVVTWSGDYIPAVGIDGGDGETIVPSPFYGDEEAALKRAENVYDYFMSKGQFENVKSISMKKVGTYGGIKDQYTHQYAMALEGEFTGVENLSVKAGVSYDFGSLQDLKNDFDFNEDKIVDLKLTKSSTLGYSTSAGYKLALNDTFYVRPQLGLAGTSYFGESSDVSASFTKMDMVAGVLFGWGDIGVDANPDVYYMDTDDYKKVSPGVSLVVTQPLVSVSKEGSTTTNHYEDKYGVILTPSFYSGEIIPGLTSAVYSNIGITAVKDVDTEVAFDIAAAAKYAIPVGAGTITPQVGVKYANKGTESLSTKIGVDVAGFVANTTFFTVYDSGNLLMEKYVKDGDPKLGTLNFGAKISF